MILKTGERSIVFPRRPLVVGILNINPDSFSGDGDLELESAFEKALGHAAAGADVIDVGGESARTNRPPVSEDEEVARVLPFLQKWPGYLAKGGAERWDAGQVWPPLISVNTWRPGVAGRLLAAGADILNDMSGLPTDENARLAADSGAALVLMHNLGEVKVSQRDRRHQDILGEMETFFRERAAVAFAAGLDRESLIIDPGIEFCKQPEDDLAIMKGLKRLLALGHPMLLAMSRKSFIGEAIDRSVPQQRDAGTVACAVWAMMHGVQMLRVHEVAAVAAVVKTIAAVEAGIAEELPTP